MLSEINVRQMGATPQPGSPDLEGLWLRPDPVRRIS